jgi:hypothetical protein
MGRLKLLIAEIAAYYTHPVARVFLLYNHLLIAYKHHQTRLELEAMQMVIYQLLSLTDKQSFANNN